MAESLAVVSAGATIGFLSHLRSGTVDLAIATPFAAFAMIGSFSGARAAAFAPDSMRMALFGAMALASSALMLQGALRDLAHPAPPAPVSPVDAAPPLDELRGAPRPPAPILAYGGGGSAVSPAAVSAAGDGALRFGPVLAGQAVAVGVLSSLAGAGGGFMIVPALATLARMPVRRRRGAGGARARGRARGAA